MLENGIFPNQLVNTNGEESKKETVLLPVDEMAERKSSKWRQKGQQI